MPDRRHDLGTGQIARALHVCPRTVDKWIDTGQLHGYRLPGPAGHRRVPPIELLAFAQQHKLPAEMLADLENKLASLANK